jgi:hypothetical protein
MSFVICGVTCQTAVVSNMVHEDISYLAMVNDKGAMMSCTTHTGDFGLSGARTAPATNGIGAKLARLVRRLSDVSAAQRQRQVDREMAGLLAGSGGRLTDSIEREMMEKALASDWTLPQ